MGLKSKLSILGIVGLSLLLQACQGSNKWQNLDLKINSHSQDAIINGSIVGAQDPIAKSVVGVFDLSSGELCSGTLIAEDIILTAAHCIGVDHSKMMIIFDRELNLNSEMKPASKIEISKYWETNQHNEKDVGDLALIQFSGGTPKGYIAAKLIFTAKTSKQKPSVVAGFGVSNGQDLSGAGTLRKTSIFIEDLEFSQTEVLISQKHGSGACHGDSGGPIFTEFNGTNFVWGVVSRGVKDPLNDCSQFAAATSLFAYKSWIYQKIQLLQRSLVDRNL